MSVDRLADLKQRQAKRGIDNRIKSDDIRINVTPEETALSSADVDNQIALYEGMDLLLTDIEKCVEDIRKQTATDAKTADEKRRQAIVNQVNVLINQVTKNAKEVKDMFVMIKEDNTEFSKNPANANSARLQVRSNLYEVRIRRFQTAMLQFSEAREFYRSNLQSRIIRHVKNVKPEMEDEDIQELVESGQAHTIISEALASDNLRAVVDELRARNKALLMLQRNVESLYQMFKDLHTLIELQGESINVIDTRIVRSLDYVRQGRAELEKAQEYQSKARKCKCGVLIVAVIVLAVVAIPVIIAFA